MPILCNTQTTVERQYFSAMKKHITSNSVQTWVTTIVNHHGTYATLVGSQATICIPLKNLSKYYVIDFTSLLGWLRDGLLYALLDAVRGLRVIRNSTENLR